MKKVLILSVAFLFVSGICAASPLTDYSQGKVAFDLAVYPNDIETDFYTFDGKSSSLDGGITVGLGRNLAFQYKQANWEGSAGSTLNNQQFNLLYKIHKNVSAFAGFSKTNAGIYDYKGPNGTDWQVGVIGSTPIAKKTTAFAIAGIGSDTRNWEVGVSYAFTKNLELNVMYRDFKADNLTFVASGIEARTKGIGYGLTYKF